MQEISLDTLGWDTHFAEHFKPFGAEGLIAARVAVEHRGAYVVYTELGEIRADLAGRARHIAAARSELPAVGDWVAAEMVPGETRAIIHTVLPRRGQFSRNVAGFATEEQVLAANIDTAFLTTSLTSELNQRRLERYLTLAWAGGASPVIVLTKADICDAPETAVAQMKTVALGVPMHITSSVTGAGIEDLRRYFEGHSTVALLGSSGVGKSSLVNTMLGSDLQDVKELRNDGKGRHTTTKRELIVLPGGGLMIDTPGMRELQLWDDTGGLEEAFEDISVIAAECHFRDCRHEQEPGCAVLHAVASGSLPQERLDSYRKLQRELRHLHLKQDRRAASEQRRKLRAVHQSRRGSGRNVGRPTDD
ncbi:MAG: ribosome small subunit-dependent GTPase A [Actinomycetota bacterium]|nr:ribosome small subunit-dependent GTPase A [Actinomycetota bacterium]